MRKLFLFSFVVIISVLSGCKRDNTVSREDEWHQQSFVISTKADGSPEAEAPINKVSVYLFKDSKLLKAITDINVDSQNKFEFSIVKNVDAYFIAGDVACNELKLIQEGTTTLQEFLALRCDKSSGSDGYKASLFYSGVQRSLSIGGNPIVVTLKRSVARLDLNTSRDSKILVKSVEIEGVSSSTTLWEQDVLAENTETTSCNVTFDQPTTSLEDIMRIYEGANQLNIRVNVLYDRIPTVVNLSLSNVKRNHKYSITLSGAGETISSSITIEPWQDGGNADVVAEKKK